MLRGIDLGSWLILLAFLLWALRLEVLEGYLYPLGSGFLGDFKSALELVGWEGRGLFYGPIFVFESVGLAARGYVDVVDFARLDYLLFGVAFLCSWRALVSTWQPRLFVLVLAGWLASHVSVALFASAQHLEALELALLAATTLLTVRGRTGWAGVTLGLAIASKTLPIVFLPYLVILRRWRTLLVSIGLAAALLLAACAFQQVSVWDGLTQLVWQGPNLTKTKATAEEYSLRAYFIRVETGSGDAAPTPRQASIAFGLEALVTVAAAGFTALALWRSRPSGRGIPLAFGLVEATMLAVAPSSHIHYYVFLLPAWTAALVELASRPLDRTSTVAWAALVGSYVLVGFDLPFVVSSRLLGIGQPVLTHWLDLNPYGLLLAFVAVGIPLLRYYPCLSTRPVGRHRNLEPVGVSS